MLKEKNNWNNFIISKRGSLLQSWQWGIFQESLGRQIWRVFAEDKVAGLIIRHPLPLGKCYLYCPYGPIVSDRQKIKLFIEQLNQIASEQKAIFLKIEPQQDIDEAVSNVGNIEKSNYIQPAKTAILDISHSDERLLLKMHHKTRYNIKLAGKKNIEIKIIDKPSEENIVKFWQLSEETAQRDKFQLHDKKYYQKMLTALAEQKMVKLFLAQHNRKTIAANIVGFFGSTVYYLHGSSDYKYRKLMATHLLQWETILQAKILGYRYYDFWGIDETKWPGVTRFKRGFSARAVTYPGAYNLIWHKDWYKLYNFFKKNK